MIKILGKYLYLIFKALIWSNYL